MKDGIEALEDIYKEHREKALDMDSKISESFILATSVIIIYASTVSIKNLFFIISEICFFIEITMALWSLWKLRIMHASAVISSRNGLEQIRNFINKDFSGYTIEKVKNEIQELKKIDPSPVGKVRAEITFLQKICFYTFLIGLVFIALQPVQNQFFDFFKNIFIFLINIK